MTRTLGQVAYEEWHKQEGVGVAWSYLPPATQMKWGAIAKAVLDAYATTPRWHTMTPDEKITTLRVVGRYAAMPERLRLIMTPGTRYGFKLALIDKEAGRQLGIYDDITSRDDLIHALEGDENIAVLRLPGEV